MKAPQDHEKERERLVELESYSILDTLPESDYDNITALAAEICNTEISLISLLDNKRQWFKSHHGLNSEETPKEYSFCAHAINDPKDIFIVQDARMDERFHDNPLVTGEPYVIFYAGVPLTSDNGLPLGTLCIIDHKPKLLSKSQIQSLSALGKQVMNLLNLRKTKQELEKALEGLEEKNQELERFAFVAAHDLKSPLSGIAKMTSLFQEEHASAINSEGNKMLNIIKRSARKLKGLIDGLLEYSKSEYVLKEKKSTIDIDDMREEILGLFSYETKLSVDLKSSVEQITTNKAALDQVVINLVANAIKYNDKEEVEIEIGITVKNAHYEFYVQDNGPGILPKHHDKIFEIFSVMTHKDRFGNSGNGIGLATVKKIVENSGGTIRLESKPNQGAKFIFTIEK